MDVPGFGEGFDAAVFREAIKNTMQMGTTTDTLDRVTFQWNPDVDYEIEDPAGNTYDFSATPITYDVQTEIQVDVAMEFIPRSTLSAGNAVAGFDTPRLRLTLLDVDWDLVIGADTVIAGGNTYRVKYVQPPIALFSVDVWVVECIAFDES